jgi:hypothetical protein
MTDNELDEILDKWTAPSVPSSLRARVRAGLPAPQRRTFRWRGSFVAAAILAGAAFFLILTQAFPQSTVVQHVVRAQRKRDSLVEVRAGKSL